MDACTFLAERAPELTIDQLATVLGARAAALESLWDAWGQVRRCCCESAAPSTASPPEP